MKRLIHIKNSRSFTPYFFGFWAFIFSYFVMPFYVGGDQIHYRGYYDGVSSLGFMEGFQYYKSMLGTEEPGYFLLTFALSGVVEKDLLMSLLNGCLVFFVVLWCCRINVSLFVLALLPFNFYILVLFFSAERLKLSLLFLVMALICTGVARYFLLLCGFFSHVQTLLLAGGKLFSSFVTLSTPLLRGKVGRGMFVVLVGFGFVCILAYLMRDHLVAKFIYYYQSSGGVINIVKPLIFILATLFYAPRRTVESLSMHFPVLLAALLVGGDRVVIFSYLIFMYYALQVGRGFNFGVLLFAVYFFVKGMFFLDDIFSHGQGFVVS